MLFVSILVCGGGVPVSLRKLVWRRATFVSGRGGECVSVSIHVFGEIHVCGAGCTCIGEG